MRTWKPFIALCLSCVFCCGSALAGYGACLMPLRYAHAEAIPDTGAAVDTETATDTETTVDAETTFDAETTADIAEAQEDAPTAEPSPSPIPTPAPVINDDFIIEPMAGYRGDLFMARWSPLFVTVTNNGPDFDGVLGVNMFLSQTEYDRYEMPLTLAHGATKRVTLSVKPMTRQGSIAYELVSDGKIVAEERAIYSRIISTSVVCVGVLTDDFPTLTYVSQRVNGLHTLRGEAWSPISLTPENFPETPELMDAFSILIVDSIDPRTLSEAQQASLTGWLLAGGIVIASGGAKASASYPFFSEWTNLSPGTLSKATDITPALLSYMTLSGDPAGEDVWLNAMPESAAFLAEDGHGLIALDPAGKGLIFSTAFDLGGAPLDTWPEMSALWPRVLRQNASDAYTRMLERPNDDQYGISYSANEVIQKMRVANDDSGIPVIAVLALYLIAIGAGGYLLLKKLDRREWLWVAVPASTAVFALLMLLLSNNTQMNKPVAMTASRIQLSGDSAQITTYIGVATPGGGDLTISTDQPQLPVYIPSGWYSYYGDSGSDSDSVYRPIDLRQRIGMGARPSIGFAATDTWDVKLLSLTNTNADIGGIDASLWIEADGIHGEITNKTEYLLEDVVVITGFGYVTPGDLLPGQKIGISMLAPDKPLDITNPNFQYSPGVMYAAMDIDVTTANFNASDNLYAFRSAAMNMNDPNAHDDPLTQRNWAMIQLINDFYYNTGASGETVFHLLAFNDALGKVAVELNGESVERTAHAAVLSAEIPFEPIGPTGSVFFHQGLIPAELIVDMGADQKPRVPTDDDGDSSADNQYNTQDTYINISSPVAIRFVIPQYDTLIIDKMTLTGSTYDYMPTLFLYNNLTEAWDSQPLLSVTMSGDDWAPYIDADGALYLRYTLGEASNRAGGMSTPQLSLKGEVQ